MLKDARGYRSPYINALNGAVAAARVVGGDVVPEETPSGTLLTIAQTRRAGRFELFCGYDNGGESGADAFCLSDGTLYVAAVAQELKPGREVFRRDGDLQPRANGWCTRKTISDGQTLTFACVRYAGDYYLIAQKDGETASALLPEALGTVDPAQLEELFTFGQFYWAGTTGDKSIRIRQDVRGDVWYGGQCGAAPAEEKILPFTVRAFEISQATSSGTTTVTKVGLYVPSENAAELIAIDEEGTSSSGLAFKTCTLLVDGYTSVDDSLPLWRDITSALSAVGEDSVFLCVDLAVNGANCVIDTYPLSDNGGIISASDGWVIPIASVRRYGGEIDIRQIRYGPFIERKESIGCRLMKCTGTPYGSGFDPLTGWTPVAPSETLSPYYNYWLMGQVYGMMSYTEPYSKNAMTASAKRHQDAWCDNTVLVQVKPLAFADFGSIITG